MAGNRGQVEIGVAVSCGREERDDVVCPLRATREFLSHMSESRTIGCRLEHSHHCVGETCALIHIALHSVNVPMRDTEVSLHGEINLACAANYL